MMKKALHHQHHECPPSQRLENIEEEGESLDVWAPSSLRPPETPTETMEFLARSWSLSSSELSKALGGIFSPPPLPDKLLISAAKEKQNLNSTPETVLKENAKQTDRRTPELLQAADPFGHSPPISPRDYGDLKLLRGVPRGKTVSGWLRDHKEKRKRETRAQNAQVYAATSVAGVAAAVAAIAAGTVFAPQTSMVQPGCTCKTGAAIGFATALVASHCIDMARAMGATRDQILTVIQSAVNAQTSGDVMALTAGAATALRGAATLRERLHKDIHGEVLTGETFESKGHVSPLNFVSKGGELLKRTRKGDLHWKQVSISMDSNWQVVAKMKSTCMAGTFVKTKKSVVKEVCSNIAAWPRREVEDVNNQKAYFGIRTPERLIEFECRSKCEKQIWAEGIQQMLNYYSNMNIAMKM